jgi:hypothetical protein
MELNHDWRGFQSVFHPRRRSAAKGAAEPADSSSMVFLVVDGKTVVSASGAEGEDTRAWTGLNVQDLAAQVPHRELVLFTRKEVDQWMNGCLQLPHFYDQMEYLRNQSVPEAISSQGKVKKVRPVARRHFLLEAIRGWWSKVLPTAYGIFIRLETSSSATTTAPREIFLLIRRGRLELFHMPDLSFLGSERSKKPQAVVQYLSEKHRVPVQGLFIPAEDWAEWSESQYEPGHENEAWRKMAFAVRESRAKLVPFRWQIAALGAAKAFLGI